MLLIYIHFEFQMKIKTTIGFRLNILQIMCYSNNYSNLKYMHCTLNNNC